MTGQFQVRSWEILTIAVVGFTILYLVVKRPKLFWPLLIISNILGLGPSLMNYFFWDKVLTAFILLGAFIRISNRYFALKGSHSSSSSSRLHMPKEGHNTDDTGGTKNRLISDYHKLIFGVWIGYMIMESLIGVIVNSDFRIIYWVLFYPMVGLIAYVVCKRGQSFPFPPVRQFSLIVLITLLAYNIGYLIYGVVVENLLDVGVVGRFAAQFYLKKTFVWTGASIASFPTIIGMCAAVFVMNDNSWKVRLLVMVSSVSMMAAGLYWAAKSAWMTIFSVLAVSLRKIKVYRIAIILVVFGALFVASAGSGQMTGFFEELIDTTQLLWSAKGGDVSRQLQFQASFMRLTDNVVTFFIGDGMYSHKTSMIPSIQKLYDEYLPTQTLVIGQEEHRDDQSGTITVFRTTAFTALLVDTGVIGMALLVALFAFVARKIILQKSNSYRILLFLTLFLTFMWQFIINTTGTMLFYLMFMPCGIIEQLIIKSASREL